MTDYQNIRYARLVELGQSGQRLGAALDWLRERFGPGYPYVPGEIVATIDRNYPGGWQGFCRINP